MARDPSLPSIVAGFPRSITTVDAILTTQRATRVLGVEGKVELSRKTTFTWSEIYLELRFQGYEEALLSGPLGPVPGYKK